MMAAPEVTTNVCRKCRRALDDHSWFIGVADPKPGQIPRRPRPVPKCPGYQEKVAS